MERVLHPEKGWYVSFDGEVFYPASEKPRLSNEDKMRGEAVEGRAEYLRRFFEGKGWEIEMVNTRSQRPRRRELHEREELYEPRPFGGRGGGAGGVWKVLAAGEQDASTQK